MKTKEEIIEFVEKRYNPDLTYIKVELSEIFDFFGITDKELISRYNEEAKMEVKG